MSLSEQLRNYNAWRRGDDDSIAMPHPKEIGLMIDRAADMAEQHARLLAAIENLHKVKGRYHTEQSFKNLIAVYEQAKGSAA